MALSFRPATLADIPVLMDIRNNVVENALVHTVIGEDDYVQAMTRDGRAWACELNGEVVGFACGRRVQGDVWALFVRQAHEGRGAGGGLMDRVEAWLFEEAGLAEAWLTTAPGTRAERLYRRRGWDCLGLQPSGELRFVLRRDAWRARS